MWIDFIHMLGIEPESAKLRTSEKEERLKEYRLQMACTMLKNTSETITTVSQNCGFHSASYFGKVFRSQMGCTPYEFKNKSVKISEDARIAKNMFPCPERCRSREYYKLL